MLEKSTFIGRSKLGAREKVAHSLGPDNISNLGMIQERGPYTDGPEMLTRDCSKWIMPEKSTL